MEASSLAHVQPRKGRLEIWLRVRLVIFAMLQRKRETAPTVGQPLNGERPGAKILIQIPFQQQWSFPVEQMAVLLVDPGKQGAFHQTGLIFKAEKFHGFALLGADNLAGDQPAEKANPSALHNIPGGQIEQGMRAQGSGLSALFVKEGDGVVCTEKTQHPVFVAQPLSVVLRWQWWRRWIQGKERACPFFALLPGSQQPDENGPVSCRTWL